MDRFWLQSYPLGVPATVEHLIQDYASVNDLYVRSCERFASKVAYTNMGAKLDYANLLRSSQRFAGWLQSQGVVKGDRVALMMPNLLQYPICLFGSLLAGAVVVNVNPLYTADELHHQLSDSGATVIVVAENFAHTVEAARNGTQLKHVVVTRIGEMLGLLKGTLVNLVLRHVRKQIPAYSLPDAHALSSILKASSSEPRAVTLGHNDLAFLQYTGGTTGRAKGAMLTHGNIVANVCQAHAWVKEHLQEGQETVVTALPLYHIFALTANCLTFLRLGATNVLITNPRDIPSFIKTLSQHRFSTITGVNTLFNALLNHPRFSSLSFHNLKVTLGGGMAVQEAVAQRWFDTTGNVITQAYGLTETSPAATINPLGNVPFNGSVGLPISSTDVALLNDEGLPVPVGEAGEVGIRGPQVTRGYWNKPEENSTLFSPDGFLRTGDIGRFDEKGFLYLLDRKKDLIVVSGFNVYPNEVESVAVVLAGVREAAAVGVPDEHSGEVVKLFVIASDPSLTAESVIEHCRKHLTRYKVPKQVEFRADLPRTNVGKILRRALRDETRRQ